MAFEEWLALGGNEILNNARTVGYAKTAACPMGWFKARPCDTLLAATLIGAFAGEDEATDEFAADYRATAIQGAPWYDPVLPDVSTRFYGAYGLGVYGIEDSTREAGVTQGLADGGVIGRVRKAPRQVRVVALLAGEGQDALEYGMAWLNAALDPNACGQHGDACGTADLAFFSTCPPPRAQVPVYSEPELVGTNLNLNPSMETPGPVVELRRNMVQNPRMQTATGWTAGGIVTPGEFGLNLHFMDAQPSGTVLIQQAEPWPLISGNERAVASMEIEVPPGHPAVTLALSLEMRDGGGEFPGANVTIQPGETKRILSGVGVPGPANSFRILVRAGAALSGSTEFYARDALSERASDHQPYFDGSTVDYQNSPFTYAWAGAADASESTQSAPTVLHYSSDGLLHVFQTRSPDAVPSRGEFAIRAVSAGNSSTRGDVRIGDVTLTPGMYTIEADLYLPAAHVAPDDSAGSRQRRILVYVGSPNGTIELFSEQAPNEPGWHHLVHTFEIPADAGGVTLGLGSAGSDRDLAFQSVWDAVSIVSGTQYTGGGGGYFDGDRSDTETEVYSWTGTAHDSTSTAHTIRFLGYAPVDNENYRLELNKVRRYLHDVGAVSGPLIQAQFQSGRHWAYQVEYTLVAANPYVFGVRREIDLPPRLPTVVADIPYNLVTHPSAEKTEGVVVVQTNYAPNPSAEVNVTGWEKWESGFSAIMDRSDEISSSGTYAASAYLEVMAATAAGFIGLRHVVPLPGITPNMRYSVNVWSSAFKRFGTGTLGNITYVAQWLDGGGTLIREDTLGTKPASGGAVTAKGLLPPAGTTQVKIGVKVDITNAAVSDLYSIYADSVAVTVP